VFPGIPVSSVGNARALADEGSAPLPALDVFGSSSANTSLTLPPPSPNGGSYSPSGTSTANKRLTLTPGGTTKVLADLQTGVANARNALENTKQQLRLSQRQVASLTRQTEDLKEGRERLRLENEGLNNVVARKERLLQEVNFICSVRSKESALMRFTLGDISCKKSGGRARCAPDAAKDGDVILEEGIKRHGDRAVRSDCSFSTARSGVYHIARQPTQLD
jgi:hypothetical protein